MRFQNCDADRRRIDYIAAKIGKQANCQIEDRTVHMFNLRTTELFSYSVLGTHAHRKKDYSRTQDILCQPHPDSFMQLIIPSWSQIGVPSSVEDYVKEVGRAAKELALTGYIFRHR